MKKFLALFLLLSLLGASLAACAGRGQAPNAGKTPTEQPPAEETPATETPEISGEATASHGSETPTPGDDAAPGVFTPVLRFVAASDVHITDTPNVRDEKFEKLFADAYAYADRQETYKNLDGAFFAGDISDNGSALSLERFFAALEGHAREGTVTRAVLGNHEYFTEPETTVDRYLAASGYESADHHIKINGYHFILLSPDKGGSGFSTAKQTWLAAQLTAAMRDDPTGKKPVFVFQHHHVRGTVYGSANTWGVTDLYPVLSMCPQVVDFSGHSHFPINDPRSVWQGTFTAFNTASLKGLEMDLVGVADERIFPTDDKGGWSTTAAGRADGGQYYIVEVDAYNRILVRAFDIVTGLEVIEPIFIESVGDPDAFTYTDARAETEAPPVFADDAAATPLYITANAALLRFPRTTGGTYVQNYRCEIRAGDEQIDTIYRLDDGFLFPAPETLTLPLTGLEPETEYAVRIVPVTSWGNEGAPLLYTFRTGENDVPLTPEQALVFSARFGADNVAEDGVSGTALTASGTPATVYDETARRYMGVFDGNSAFEYHGIGDYYPVLTRAFTFETYVRMDARPETGYVNHFANMQGGGFGFEYKADGRMMFFLHVGGQYASVTLPALPTGVFAHLVVTYDGEKLTLYQNGAKVTETAVSGEVGLPSVHFLSVGGDSEAGGSGKFAACTVGCANVYRAALSPAEIAALYAAYTH